MADFVNFFQSDVPDFFNNDAKTFFQNDVSDALKSTGYFIKDTWNDLGIMDTLKMTLKSGTQLISTLSRLPSQLIDNSQMFLVLGGVIVLVIGISYIFPNTAKGK